MTARRLRIAVVAACVPLFFVTDAAAQEEGSEEADATDARASEGWEAELYRRHRPSVVRVDVLDGMGTGFVFGSGRQVATAFHVVDDARRVYVWPSGGERLRATVVAVDREHDLAILEVSEDLAVAPLEPVVQDEAPVVGDPVVAIGHPFGSDADGDEEMEGMLNWSLTRGVVSALGEELIQTDAAVNPGNSGGPLLDRHGRVVGVVTRRSGDGIGLAVRVHRLVALVEEVGEQGLYRGRWRFDFGMGLDMQFDRVGSWIGGYLEMGTVGYDRVGLIGRLSLFSLIDGQGLAPLYQNEGLRLTMAVEANYRIPIPLGRALSLDLVLGVGAAATWQSIEERRMQLRLADAGCDLATEMCDLETSIESSVAEGWLIRPTFSLGLELAILTLSYSFHLDVLDPAASTHQLLLGITY